MSVFDFENLEEKYSRTLDKIAEELLDPYQNFVGKLSVGKEESLDWWVSNIASRNPYASPLFYECCKLKLIVRLIDSKEIETILVPTVALKRILLTNPVVQNSKIRIEVKYPLSRKYKIRIYFNERWKYAREFFRTWVTRARAAKRTKKIGKRVADKKPITLVDTYIKEDFVRDGQFQDRYFGNLFSNLDPNTRDSIYFIFTAYEDTDFLSLYTDLRKHPYNFLIKEDFLTLSDYLYSFFFPYRLNRLRFTDCSFQGFDLTYLVEFLVDVDRWEAASIEALLNSRFIHRLKRNGFRIRFLLDWWENQWFDRGLHHGMNRYFPEVPSLGYCGYTMNKFHLNVFPTDYERNANILPKKIGVIGSRQTELIKRYCPRLSVVLTPALRFEYLFLERKLPPKKDVFVILISLSILVEQSIFLLKLAIDSLNEFYKIGFEIWIKPHPVNTRIILENFPKESLPKGFSYVSGDFNESLLSSNLLVGFSSSTCLEAVAMGIPTIVIRGGKEPTSHPLDERVPKEIWSVCYTSEEFKEQVLDIRSSYDSKKELYQEIGAWIRENYFSPVDEGSKRRMLGYDS
ncbi:hypothetical protein EHQ12_18885 [Leptospira gomenensis]|uniref:Uncharacterized protein n=1 Tax=Leptospira gomenensis TaxID=2484974 RepID=A0A5F1Z074_9LEPT|nr:hypothetical protein [Leptospira gomenensis]TGK30918.1 hypothetical protein EHQ17_14430 [Leptospira gomenensis]TGK32556.1 hypothetical protein EHQ12_18885 [Leptospira gomenensis]TGK45362.1 hypothetical protein EHQ07_10565 [Leptospira gomenensis]TGK66275.1 hypothetical protein EHQ13_04300 [Leptospira gomenensis]